MTTNRNRIDLHHHVFAPELITELERLGIEYTGGAGVPPWSVPAALEMMARHDIQAAIASVQPFIHWPRLGQTVRWASYSNEFLARVVRENPEHYGGLATLPLPDTDAALRELEYALDVLKLDGVSVTTSIEGRYLGDPDYEELFQELEKRSAVVVLHPTTMPPGASSRKLPLPDSLVEFVFDSTRTVASLLYSGRLARYPSIRYVVPHAGGTVPYLAQRISMGAEFVPRLREMVPMGALHYLRRLYYDTAVATAPLMMSALHQFVPTTQIVYGSDFPYVRDPLLTPLTASLDGNPIFDEAAHAAINRGNALTLFPRFAHVEAGL